MEFRSISDPKYLHIGKWLVAWKWSAHGGWKVDERRVWFYCGTKYCPIDFGGLMIIVGPILAHIGEYTDET